VIRRTRRSRSDERSPDDWFGGADEHGSEWLGGEEEWRERAPGDPDWGHAEPDEPPTDPYDDVWEDADAPPRPRAQQPMDPVVRRRRLVGLAVILGLAVIAIAVPVALLGGGESTVVPTVTPTIEPAPTTPPTTPAPTTTTTPAADLPLVDVSETGPLRLGDQGEAVEQLQRALIALELDPGEPDGDFGTATQDAVVAFQEANGLEADGIVGEETARLINEALAAA